MGAHAGDLALLLRTGAPLRFRPGHADLLHLDLRRGEEALLRDGGTGTYNPPPGCGWWTEALAGSAGHNTVEFDGEAQMPRVSRFLMGRWPRCEALPDGAAFGDLVGLEPRRHAVEHEHQPQHVVGNQARGPVEEADRCDVVRPFESWSGVPSRRA